MKAAQRPVRPSSSPSQLYRQQDSHTYRITNATPERTQSNVRSQKGTPRPTRPLQLSRHQLGDLGGVQGGALAEVVAADEEVDRLRVIQRPPDPADPGRVGAHHVCRGGELALRRVVAEH